MNSEKKSEPFVFSEEISWETIDKGSERKILAYNKELMMVQVQFKKGGIGKLHHHPHRQISFIVDGAFEVEIDGQKKILNKGDSFIVETDLVHGVVALEDAAILDIFTPFREDFLRENQK
jgi:quercetin dioxygenase-like cupin family protein